MLITRPSVNYDKTLIKETLALVGLRDSASGRREDQISAAGPAHPLVEQTAVHGARSI